MLVDWQIQGLAPKCAARGTPFAVGERIVCLLYRDSDGQLQRVDLCPEAEATFTLQGQKLGRWVRVLRPAAEADKAARKQVLDAATECFLSLYNGESALPEMPQDEAELRNALCQILALLLERKRRLKPVGAPEDALQHYRYPATGQQVQVPLMPIKPQVLAQVQKDLGDLLGLA
jgi:hypothetical protein